MKTLINRICRGNRSPAHVWAASLLCLLFIGGEAAGAASLQEELFTSAAAWVSTQTSSAAETIKFAPLDQRIKVQPCTSKIEFDFPFANKSTVRAKCNQPNWQLFIKVSFAQPINAVVARHALVAGQILNVHDLEISTDAAATTGSFREREPLVGRLLKRNLAKGQLLLAQDLETSLQVLKLKQNLRANELITSAVLERVQVSREGIPSGVWQGAELPPGARLTRDMQAGQILQTSDLTESRQVVVANVNMAAGQALKAGALRLERLDQDKVSRTHLFELSGLDGFEVIRTIRAGEAIRTTDLRPALLVKRGEMVVLSIGRPSEFEITIKLEAMQDGRMGEQIRLRNAETGRILNGIVTGPGQLRGS